MRDEQTVSLEADRVEAFFEQTVEINGQRLTPDPTKGYVEFRLSHAFPVVTAWNSALHAGTVANSYQSLLHQNFNYRHTISSYFKGTDKEVREDRIVGSVVGVEFPRTPGGGWRVTDRQNAPGIRGVAVLHKQAKGIDKILGQHHSGRQEWTVSMELDYFIQDSGILLLPTKDAKEPKGQVAELLSRYTPRDFRSVNAWYLPFVEAPDELLDKWSKKHGMFTQDNPWYGHHLVTLMGGLNGTVHYKGVGLVQYGAEPAATVDQMLAEDEKMQRLSDGLNRLGGDLDRLFEVSSHVRKRFLLK